MLNNFKSLFSVVLFLVLALGMVVQTSIAQTVDQSTPKSGYMAFLNGQNSGDIDQFNKTITAAKIKKNPSPEELKMFSSLAQLTPTNVQISNEIVNGNKASMSVSGFVPICEGNGEGTVTMVKEDGVWKVDTESWKSTSTMPNGETSTCTFGFGIEMTDNK